MRLGLLSAVLVLGITSAVSGQWLDPLPPALSDGDSTSSSDTSTATPSTGSSNSTVGPLLPYQKYIATHAIMSVIGFLVLLPTGAIIARWMRTFKPVWFRIHWIIQWCLAFPIILTGFALGITSVNMNGGLHQSDTHMRWGAALFSLYLLQLGLGGIIHFYKVPSLARNGTRAPQNYFHAVFGIFIIAAAFFQVRTGFRKEWPLYTGRGSLGKGASGVWYFWLVLVILTYFSGLYWLRRQFRQEREAVTRKNMAPLIAMSHRNFPLDKDTGP